MKKPRYSTPTPSDTSEQRTFRRSTQEVSAEHKKRHLEEERRRRRFTPRAPRTQYKMTQQELLEEAKWTEAENIASLEAFTQLEEEKKKVKEKRNVVQSPVIRFHSVSMPVIKDITSTPASSLHTPPSPPDTSGATQSEKPEKPKMYCRNFLVFTDVKAFPSSFFPTHKPAKPKRLICPVTGLPAKYIDPITETPYATPQAFKIIRNRYISAEEEKCEKRLLQLSSWLEEKKRKKQESRI